MSEDMETKEKPKYELHGLLECSSVKNTDIVQTMSSYDTQLLNITDDAQLESHSSYWTTFFKIMALPPDSGKTSKRLDPEAIEAGFVRIRKDQVHRQVYLDLIYISPEYRKSNLAKQTLIQLFISTFGYWGMERISCSTLHCNPAGNALMKSVGMDKFGIGRSSDRFLGEMVDRIHYEFLDDSEHFKFTNLEELERLKELWKVKNSQQ